MKVTIPPPNMRIRPRCPGCNGTLTPRMVHEGVAFSRVRVQLSETPAWPTQPQKLPTPIAFDSLWCSEDNRVRVAEIRGKFFVSIAGDNFAGPFKTAAAAKEYAC